MAQLWDAIRESAAHGVVVITNPAPVALPAEPVYAPPALLPNLSFDAAGP
jgi:hypothetical protein